MISNCNKIRGKVTKFGGKRKKILGVANRFMVGGGGGHRVKTFFNFDVCVV